MSFINQFESTYYPIFKYTSTRATMMKVRLMIDPPIFEKLF